MTIVEYASMTSSIDIETPDATPDATPMSVPASLGAVGYAAFALLQAIPLSEIVPFSMVVSAFEAEGDHPAPAPVMAPAPVPVHVRVPVPVAVPVLVAVPAPEPAPIVAAITPIAPPASPPAISFVEGGYRPEPGPKTWGREPTEMEKAAAWPGHKVDAAAAVNAHQDWAAPHDVANPSDGVAAVPVGAPQKVNGYAVTRPSDDRKARQVLDELSFLFDGN